MVKDFASCKSLTRTQVLSIVAIGSFLFGAIIAGIGATFMQAQQPRLGATGLRSSDISVSGSGYKFIDPLIGVLGGNDSTVYANVKNQVATYIASQKNDGLITASVDFRDIGASGGFTLNPSEHYTPASLNKVPVMIAYYKIAEGNPSILSDEIPYTADVGNRDNMEEIKSVVQLKLGTTYTVEQLIEHMIRYSDNNATYLLTQHLIDTNNFSVYTTVFSDLGIDPSVLDQNADNVTASEYSIFLRALYNATYLNRDDSERALQLLSESDFTKGIEGGVPNGVLVAQKFGEVNLVDTNGTQLGKEIHDCGVVYYPDHPYLLCVMTKATGDDVERLEGEIASISSIVYKNMQIMYP